jgi:hypothetical protein
MYRPTITRLIEQLDNIREQHGDTEVVGLVDDEEFPSVYAEWNDDEGAVTLIILERSE